MLIYDILSLKFPNASFSSDIILQDDGQGAYIKEWNIPDVTQPTQEDLDAWQTGLQIQYELKQVIMKRASEYPPKEDLIVALWERIVEGRTTATDEIQAKRQTVKDANPKPIV